MQSRVTLAGAAVLAVLLATAGIAGAFSAGGSPAQAQQQAMDSNTITVSGNGEVQAEADRAVIRVAVLATGDDISSVRKQVAENSSAMRSALTDMGISDDQIQTRHYDISSNKRHHEPRGEEPNYRAIHAFTITVEETDRAGAVIDTAVSNGASEVDGVTFTLSADKREELRQQALEEAMDSARGEASTIAAAEDLSIADVNRVSTTGYSHSPRRALATPAAGDAGGTSINSGPVSVSASVTVVYDTQS